ncbi:hypothetical protein JB92DRAFT_2755403, partial [Gautieria morchelliformis]
NPLDRSHANSIPDPPTQTLPSHAVYAEAQAHLKPLLRGIQTREQLDKLVIDLRVVHQEQQLNPSPPFNDPPLIQQKGRLRTARITSGREGVPRGGGQHRRLKPSSHPVQQAVNERNPVTESPPRKRRAPPTCSLCHQPGHNRLGHYQYATEVQEAEVRKWKSLRE